MDEQQLIESAQSLDGVLTLAPAAGDGTPEIAWGDSFFYYAPDGQLPQNEQPFATIVTKDYPDDAESRLGDGRWRLNIHVDRATFRELTGEDPSALALPRSFDEADTVLPHPVYGSLSWISVVTPGPRTSELVIRLLGDAHAAARARYDRRRTD